MKRLIISFFFSLLLTSPLIALGFDATANCKQPLIDVSGKIGFSKIDDKYIQGLFDNYQTNGKFNDDGSYSICFDPTKTKESAATFQISASESAPLIIYGLNLSTSSSLTGPLLNLSGSSITLQNVTLAGNSTLIDIVDGASDIAFQGTNSFTTAGSGPIIKIPENYGVFELSNSIFAGAGIGAAIEIPNGVDAIIQKNTISNFAEGIKVAANASVPLIPTKLNLC